MHSKLLLKMQWLLLKTYQLLTQLLRKLMIHLENLLTPYTLLHSLPVRGRGVRAHTSTYVQPLDVCKLHLCLLSIAESRDGHISTCMTASIPCHAF